jgi:DNA (cytosine-5)-methyltransferase 1
MKNSKLKVVELFAGVGGFRIGLEGFNGKSPSSGYKKKLKSNYEVVWSNQYEPSTPKNQHASRVYEERFGADGHSNENIEKVIEDGINNIPNHDLLVGGFPCQDYSVATTLKRSKGLQGKKGVLWWSIYSILSQKKEKKPGYLLLENVDRLISSPAKQRGRDFAVILSCLYEQGYSVEWRVINAAEYSMPQKRKRIYILAYHKSTSIYKKMAKESHQDWLLKTGIHANAFPVNEEIISQSKGVISGEPSIESEEFNLGGKTSPFLNSGICIGGKFTSIKTKPKENKIFPLKDILLEDLEIAPEYFINDTPLEKEIVKEQIDRENIVIKSTLDMWEYLKGRKNEERINKAQGFKYKYGEGSMSYPDGLDKPSRTIITGEGGKSPSRFKHVIYKNGKHRRLTPIELERLNMFPDNHTYLEGVTDAKRAFFMGNALVIGIVERLGNELNKEING